MLRILLLDCAGSLREKLGGQGFKVESGTAGYCTGQRELPSQVYEKDIIIYNPGSVSLEDRTLGQPENLTPQFDLNYIGERIDAGASLVVFINQLHKSIEVERYFYDWIPFMPKLDFTHDKIVHGDTFDRYPYTEIDYLAPIVTPSTISIPVLHKIQIPPVSPHKNDVFPLFWNNHRHCLGLLLLRGRGRVIFLPKYRSNDEVIEMFLHRVAPRIYDASAYKTLADEYQSPAELLAREQIGKLVSIEEELTRRQESARVELNSAKREKKKIIEVDSTAKQIQVYYDQARREDDAAVFYLYKMVEAIENKFGGESQGIEAVGARVEWKAIKRLANESYRDARHAPKPTDVIRKWTNAEISDCFQNAKAVASAYFRTLFQPPPDGTKNG